MNKTIIIIAALFGVLAVVAGAFGAHGLKALIEPAQLEVWHTGVEYNFYHVFALMYLSLLPKNKTKWVHTSFYLFVFGILFFSGSLYLLACRDLLRFDWLWIMGPITPIGGLLFIAGWVSLAIAAVRSR